MDPSQHRGAPSHPRSDDNDNDNDSTSNSNDQNHHRVRFAEGEPQASYRIYQPSSRPSVVTASSAALPSVAPPAVYWDGDDDRDSNRASLAGYTFYREGTPPPPEYENPEKRLGYGGPPLVPGAEGSTAGGGTIASDRDFSQGPLNQGRHSNWSVADSTDAFPARARRISWTIIAVGVLILIAVAVGVGVGLGVGLPKGQGPAVEATGPSSTLPVSALGSNPAPTSPPTATPSNTGAAEETTTGSAGTPRPTYNSDCPALNNTIYHVPGSTRSFLRICGIDYSGGGATDLAHAYTESMADCMNSCASFDQCTACSWGYIDGDEGSKHRCYMKKDLRESHVAASDWCFAILQ